MAIATGTATLIAAGAGLAATGVTTGMSFSQANKQKKLRQKSRCVKSKQGTMQGYLNSNNLGTMVKSSENQKNV